ncbi:MAG: hypothetical protein Q9164_001655 [Protoblastenia rupestris]
MSIVGPIAMGWGITRRKVYSLLVRTTSQALEGKKSTDKEPQARGHLIQWIAEMTRLQDAAAVAKITLGLLFASAFQVPVVRKIPTILPTIAQFCIYNFCKHPEYRERLRLEAVEYNGTLFSSLNQEMPYLDSFLKETARLSPGPIVSAPRHAMVPYTTPGGHHIPAGNWLAIPQVSLMRDKTIWPRALEFEGFRFVNEKDGTSESRFTHPSHEFPFWGAIRHACPARFYVSAVMKMILSHLIVEYEFELVDPTARSFLVFGKTRLPNPLMSILVRKRPASEN